MSIHSHLPYDQSTSHARIPAGGINLIASIDSVSEEQITASFFGSTKALHGENAIPSAEATTHNHSNQQYSITAVTTSAGAIAERYAYSAYGEPTILDGSGSVLANSAINNRYSYTGREWDATVGLHHFRARWMSPKSGRFLGKDPIGYKSSERNLYEYCVSSPLVFTDSSGLIVEIRTVCTYRLLSIDIDRNNPPEECTAEFEIERVCQMGKRDNYNSPRRRDGWYYWPIDTFISTYVIEGDVNPDYCGPCADIHFDINGPPKNGNIPPQNTDTGWKPVPPILIA